MDDQIEQFIKDAQIKEESFTNKNLANVSNKISSALGAETSLSVLTDIRGILQNVLDSNLRTQAYVEEKEERDLRRHEQLCGILMALSVSSPKAGVSHSTSHTPSPSKATVGDTFYYSSNRLVNGGNLLACILMHLDEALMRESQFSDSSSLDKTFMDFKTWCSLCATVLNALPDIRKGQRIPKPSEEDFKAAARIVASTIAGRTPRCNASHFRSLVSECPALMSTVEWLRTTIIECRGLLSEQRERRLLHTMYPYTQDGERILVIQDVEFQPTSAELIQSVKELKVPEKKKYVEAVILKKVPHEDAVHMAK